MPSFGDAQDKYSGDLKFKLVWISNGQKDTGMQIIVIRYNVYNEKHTRAGRNIPPSTKSK